MNEKPLNKRQIQYNTTLDAIRHAVDELVGEVGFEKMRIQDIADRVGIALGTFYHYFKSKEDLLHDRFVRSNLHMNHFYETELKSVNEAEALHIFVVYVTEYMKSRVTDIYASYIKTKVDHYAEWTAKVPEAKQRIFRLIIESGFENRTLSSKYTIDQIVDFIDGVLDGIAYKQCQTQGEFLNHSQAIETLHDWIENLRA